MNRASQVKCFKLFSIGQGAKSLNAKNNDHNSLQAAAQQDLKLVVKITMKKRWGYSKGICFNRIAKMNA